MLFSSFGCGLRQWRSSNNVQNRFIHGTSKLFEQTKIAIVGSGAVGSYFGARLWEVPQYNVEFLMRGAHLNACRTNGLKVDSVHGDIHVPPSDETFFEASKDMGKADWIVLALKSTAMPSVPDLIKPLLHEDTKLIACMNGLVERDMLKFLQDADCKVSSVYGGMVFLASNRVAPGLVHHSSQGSLAVGLATNGNREKAKREMEDLWSLCPKIGITWEQSLLRGRWRKQVINLAANGLTTVMGGISLDLIMKDPEMRSLFVRLMEEAVSVANADLAFHQEPCKPLGQAEIDHMVERADMCGDFKTSTAIDFALKRPMEIKYLFREALDRAKDLRVEVPHLETMIIQLEGLQKLHNLY